MVQIYFAFAKYQSFSIEIFANEKYLTFMTTIKDRFNILIDHYADGNKSKFAAEIGVAHTVIENVVGARLGNPSFSLLRNLLHRFPDVNPKWLIVGEGKILKDKNSSLEVPMKELQGVNSVPLIPFEAIAGFGGNDNEGIRYEDCAQYTVPEFEKSGVEFVVRVSGSSMYPKYSSGDILACKKIYDILFFQWGKIYVIDSSQGILVKRIYEDNESTDNIILVSDNKEKYPPFPMPKSDIRSLSIVLGVIRME